MSEVDRIKNVYQRRDSSGKRKLYSLFNPASLFAEHQREVDILSFLPSVGITDLSPCKILDLGSGNGGVLRSFIRYGAMPENCFGVDLLQSRIDEAKSLSPNIDFRCGNAESLPYSDAAFDMVLCFTVFTSILDPLMKQHIAKEMLRVLKSGGSLFGMTTI